MHFIGLSTCINPTAEDLLVLGPCLHSGASELSWNVCGVEGILAFLFTERLRFKAVPRSTLSGPTEDTDRKPDVS